MLGCHAVAVAQKLKLVKVYCTCLGSFLGPSIFIDIYSSQWRELGQFGEHGVHAQLHVIQVLEPERGSILEVSHVLAMRVIQEIVTVSSWKTHTT